MKGTNDTSWEDKSANDQWKWRETFTKISLFWFSSPRFHLPHRYRVISYNKFNNQNLWLMPLDWRYFTKKNERRFPTLVLKVAYLNKGPLQSQTNRLNVQRNLIPCRYSRFVPTKEYQSNLTNSKIVYIWSGWVLFDI